MARMCRLVINLPGVGSLFLPHGSGRLNSGCQLPYSLSHFSSINFFLTCEDHEVPYTCKMNNRGTSSHIYKNQARLLRVEATELSMRSLMNVTLSKPLDVIHHHFKYICIFLYAYIEPTESQLTSLFPHTLAGKRFKEFSSFSPSWHLGPDDIRVQRDDTNLCNPYLAPQAVYKIQALP